MTERHTPTSIEAEIEKHKRANEIIKRVGFAEDIDGVRVDTAPLGIKSYNEIYNDTKTVNDITRHYIMDDWLKEKSATNTFDLAMEIWNSEKVLGKSLPLSGATIVSRYQFEEHDFVAPKITSRPSAKKEITLAWFSKWEPWVSPDKVYIQEKGLGIGLDFKKRTIESLGVAFFLEDSVEQAEKIIEGMNTIIVIVPQPWNRNYQPKTNQIVMPYPRFVGQPSYIQAYLTLVEEALKRFN